MSPTLILYFKWQLPFCFPHEQSHPHLFLHLLKRNSLLLMYCMCPQLCLTLCDSVDCSLPGSSVHGIFQARILEWVAVSTSRGSTRPRNRSCVSCNGSALLNLLRVIAIVCFPCYEVLSTGQVCFLAFSLCIPSG